MLAVIAPNVSMIIVNIPTAVNFVRLLCLKEELANNELINMSMRETNSRSAGKVRPGCWVTLFTFVIGLFFNRLDVTSFAKENG